jgi:hypothetical protein
MIYILGELAVYRKKSEEWTDCRDESLVEVFMSTAGRAK